LVKANFYGWITLLPGHIRNRAMRHLLSSTHLHPDSDASSMDLEANGYYEEEEE